MEKLERYSFKGMLQDLLKSKQPSTYYFEGKNIRISNSEDGSDRGITNEDGNSFVVTLPNPTIDAPNAVINYGSQSLTFSDDPNSELVNGDTPLVSGTQVIIGSTPTRESFILFSTDNAGFDCVWDVDVEEESNNYTLTLLYVRNLGFSSSNPIQAIYNYENTKVQKIYWVDGVNQLRFLNLQHSIANGDKENLIDINSKSVNIVGEFNVSQPIVTEIGGGGTHTAGVVQYAYNLYRINGSQTSISPISTEVPLGKGVLGGGAINEIVGESPIITIDTLDEEFTHIKIYAIKYTSYNETPSVSIIVDENIPSYTNFQFYDTGAILEAISVTEFLFLGGNPILPKHIANKYNILFAGNIKENQFLFNIDARAYSHNSSGNYTIYDNLYLDASNNVTGTSFSENSVPKLYNVSINNDSVNIDFDNFKYTADGLSLGGEGKFFSYELVAIPKGDLTKSLKYYKFFKSLEVYRIGIQFYNKLGQISFPKWVADFRAPDNNLNGSYNVLRFLVNESALNAYIAAEGLTGDAVPVGYRVLRAVREINDKSIIAQGALTGMMVQTTNDVKNYNYWQVESNRAEETEQRIKTPWLFTREFNSNVRPFNGAFNLNMINETGFGETNDEIYRDNDQDFKRQQSWLYTRMFQMHSPDALFNTGISEAFGLQLRIKGLATGSENNMWVKSLDLDSLTDDDNEKEEGVTDYIDVLENTDNSSQGLVGPSQEVDATMRYTLVNKKYNNFEANTVVTYNIKGTPMVTERGQGAVSYNGENKFQFANSFINILSDKVKGKKNDNDGLVGINSYGSRCITIVEENEKDLYEFYQATNIGNTDGIIIAEIVKNEEQILLGNMYGGNSYERKLATSYVEIGNYQDLDIASALILSPGDTYAGNFKVARVCKTDTEALSDTVYQLTETLEFPSESSVSLLNRNDLSLQVWDAKFQPRYDEYHEYNRVYSTQPSIVERVDKNFKFKSITEFDTRVMASKTKVPGEALDSWTDFLDNETMDLEGKYGDINSLISSNNEIYALQDSGVAKLSISPNVQVQAADGISIELGKGSVLYDYKYLSTFSGSLNKWSVIPSPTGFYYYDALNKSIMVETGGKILNLSNMKGLRTYLTKNTTYSSLILDNPILKTGISGAFNTYDKKMYMTFLTPGNNFTISFSEKDNEFDSFYDFTSSMYLQKGFNFLSIDTNNNSIYKHGNGKKGEFYGTIYPSSITLLAAPQTETDKIFNNLSFKSEAYTYMGADLPLVTIDTIKVWNEFQDTGDIGLVVGRQGNINRKFREWNLIIPKIPGTRFRVRNPWAFIKLSINNEDNNKLVLHDITLGYTV